MLVVSDDAFNRNERYPKVLVVHLTSAKRAGGPFDWEVEIPRRIGGLDRTSVAKCAEVYTLWKDQLETAAGTLPSAILRKVDRALCIALGLPATRD
jgi:mRNA-degrading endonuclease toxin of MazEF toxin-antitoxin module